MDDKIATLGLDDLEKSHPDYEENVELWELIDDVCRGSRCVKARATRYLPKLDGETDDAYRSRRQRAKFFAATGRTKEALGGMLMRKSPEVEAGPIGDEVIGDVTLNGQSLEDYALRVAEASVSKGRGGTFIDWSESEKAPYLSFYKAADVINWATTRVNGREVLTMLVLREFEDHREGFEVSRRKRIRRYEIEVENVTDADEGNDAIGGAVYFETWIETASKDGAAFESETPKRTLTRRGIPLTRIPFVFHNATTLGSEVGEAPLGDIAELNISHYTTSASLENGRHLVGLPTPYAIGIDDNVKELRLGAETAWLIENENAKVGFLEFTGAGLGELREALKETEDQMSQLGARLLFDQKKAVESTETHEMRASAETAALSKIAATASVGMTEVLQWLAWWGGTFENPSEADVSFVFNQDFVSSSIAPTLLDSLFKVYVAGGMSFEAFFFNLDKGELYPDDWDIERELAAINAAQALPGPSRTVVPDEEEDDEEEDDDDEDNPDS
jgi:hypothetical protein